MTTEARACSIAAPTQHVVDPSMQATDQTAPMLPPIPDAQVTRGKGPKQEGCGQSASSCDDIGTITIAALATDDVTDPSRIGYRFTYGSDVSSYLPSGFQPPAYAVEPQGGFLMLNWLDGATDGQETLNFTLQVVAIDLAGNVSAPQTVRIFDNRNEPVCALAGDHTPRPGLGWIATLVLLAAAVARRRRR